MKVIKRNGQYVDFNEDKIYNAISKANKECKDNNEKVINDNLLGYIVKIISETLHSLNRAVSVEEIQDIVEKNIAELGFYDVSKRYIKYRYKRELARNDYNELMKAVKEKILAENVQNQNANVDEHSFGGRVGEMSDLVMKRYALEYCVSEMARNNHLNNMIYIHDLSSYPVGNHNCLSIPFDNLLKNGFNTRQTDIRPANSVSTAFQLLAVISQIQSLQQFGGCSATHLDWTMIPYVRKSFSKHFKDALRYIENCNNEEYIKSVPSELSFDDKEANDEIHKNSYKYAMDMTTKETYQAVEGMYHNLNSLQSRSGNQLPFTSINYGTCTLPEGRLITKALLEGSIKGVGKLHRTSIFPCGIFQYMKGVNDKEGTPNYDLYKLALKSTSQRLYPNYANVDWSGNKGYDINNPCTYFATMG